MRHGGPNGVEVSNELRRGGHPSGDGGGARANSTRTLEGEVNRKVVREEGWKGGGGDFEVSVVKRNGNSRKDNRVTGERVREENAINARGPA